MFAYRYRFGGAVHNMLALRSGDAWQTQGLSDAALIAFYGVPPALLADAETRRCILRYIRVQAGPTRDAIPAVAA
jgi:hypothetical protein